MNRFIRITVPGRIHVNLFDMSRSGYRQNGGVGFSITGFDTVFEFESSERFEIVDQRMIGYTAAEKEAILIFLRRLYEENGYHKKIIVKILSGPPPHSGFGTGTATKLACSEAVSIINEVVPDTETLIRSSGRGGTSGVGINTYFKGGMSIDFGVKSQGLALAPSSARQHPQLRPVQLIHLDLPEDWRFGVVVSPHENKISTLEEVNFFNRTCPIKSSSVYQSIYHAVSGMACAAVENDYLIFASSIAATQELEWKKAEWMAQSDEIRALRHEILNQGAECVGLSSLGSTMYFMATDTRRLINSFNSPPKRLVSVGAPNNIGRSIEID